MTTTTWTRLENAVKESPYDAGVSLLTLDGQSWGHRADEQFSAASVIKIPIMLEVFQQIDAGQHSLDDRFTLGRDDKAPGSGVLLDMHDSIEVTLLDLLYLMISISDNTATNVLIDLAGMDNINQRMRGWGFEGTVLNRKMQGKGAQPGQKENYVVPAECSRMIRMILSGEAASSESCQAMVELLKKQQNRRRLARPLTDEHEHIEFGSKTGTIKGVCSDAGFFRSGDRAVILSVLLGNVADTNVAETAIGAIAEAALRDAGIL
jgi:beta-lactamase class A